MDPSLGVLAEEGFVFGGCSCLIKTCEGTPGLEAVLQVFLYAGPAGRRRRR